MDVGIKPVYWEAYIVNKVITFHVDIHYHRPACTRSRVRTMKRSTLITVLE